MTACTHGGAPMNIAAGARCPYCGTIVEVQFLPAARPMSEGSTPSLSGAGRGLPTIGNGSPHTVVPERATIAATAPTTAAMSPHGLDCGTLTPAGNTGPSLLDLIPAPAARNTDPGTAHQAAQSITAAKQRDSHALVLRLLAEHGPLSDFDLARLASAARGHTVKQTSLGVRRKELERAGLVVEHDRAGISDTGSPCIRWALTDSKEHAA